MHSAGHLAGSILGIQHPVASDIDDRDHADPMEFRFLCHVNRMECDMGYVMSEWRVLERMWWFISWLLCLLQPIMLERRVLERMWRLVSRLLRLLPLIQLP